MALGGTAAEGLEVKHASAARVSSQSSVCVTDLPQGDLGTDLENHGLEDLRRHLCSPRRCVCCPTHASDTSHSPGGERKKRAVLLRPKSSPFLPSQQDKTELRLLSKNIREFRRKIRKSLSITQNCLFFFFGLHLQQTEGPGARGRSRAAAAGQLPSHSHTGSLPYLQPMPQLAATLDL